MGFGHRVYKNYDPRAKIIKEIADQVFEVMGRNPLLDIALELERIALPGRLFYQAQALSQRRFLFRLDLSVDGTADGHVSGAVSRFRELQAGSLSGKKCSPIPTKN